MSCSKTRNSQKRIYQLPYSIFQKKASVLVEIFKRGRLTFKTSCLKWVYLECLVLASTYKCSQTCGVMRWGNLQNRFVHSFFTSLIEPITFVFEISDNVVRNVVHPPEVMKLISNNLRQREVLHFRNNKSTSACFLLTGKVFQLMLRTQTNSRAHVGSSLLISMCHWTCRFFAICHQAWCYQLWSCWAPFP